MSGTPANGTADDTQALRVPPRQNLAPLLVPLVVGGLVAVALGVYGRTHTPTGFAVGPAGFSGPLAMKSWLTTGAFLLAGVQVFSALVMWGRIRLDAPWIGALHRWSGRAAFLLTIPVAFHCLYALGAQFDVARVLVHSLLGCFFYGVFTAKMLALPKRGLPGWTLPLLGGLAFTALAGLWVTSSLWFFTTIGVKL
ncbi:DUF6529 family protein [Planomonospora parontospora]|uniref:DUF6529 family protein n=1 Tax=Planomonospora parontospora TaxID=58119 RepID=UPI0019443363|nr:DUF6529 family protein [Planomonospora parontospora]GGL10265.1 hypothetical protein GCM10014719_10230 [Planomonospora parontospora subsp. antibiotica]GII14737.1 hypothetical protein Ppa05_14630 [Planomonospora parontospora subsp. antibiotica]